MSGADGHTASVTLGRVTSVTEAVGYGEQHSTGYAYDAAGDLTAVTDPRGIVTRFAHDTAGRVTGVTAASGVTTHVNMTP